MPLGTLILEVAQGHATPTAAATRLALVASLGQRPHAEAHQRLDIVGATPIAGRDQHLPHLLDKTRLDLLNAAVNGVGCRAGSLE